MPAIRRVLTIAGSDSGGGAGIQADLKAFARCGVYGMTAITMVTAQNTVGVDAAHAVPPEIVVAQIRSVAADIGIDAIKIGMLGEAETVAAVAGCLLQLGAGMPIVVDPVLVSTSGARLLATDALGALLRLIVPLATVLTPNLPEARALVRAARGDPVAAAAGPSDRAGVAGVATDHTPNAARTDQTADGAGPATDRAANAAGTGQTRANAAGPGQTRDTAVDGSANAAGPAVDDAADLARALHELGPGAVVVTGGHRAGGADLFYAGAEIVEISGPRHPGRATHGSGCTHSAVLAAQLALGLPALAAARIAREMAGEAIGHGREDIGGGDGPVDVLGTRSVNRH